MYAVKLAKQVLHRSASGSLLAQSYLSMVLLFAGLYTLEYRFKVRVQFQEYSILVKGCIVMLVFPHILVWLL